MLPSLFSTPCDCLARGGQHAAVALPGNLAAPGAARRFLRRFCGPTLLSEQVCEHAALLASEVVTSALELGGSESVLELHLPAPCLQVRVADLGAAPVRAPLHAEPAADAERGRGLLLVEALATRWGARPLPTGGTLIWFDLDVPVR